MSRKNDCWGIEVGSNAIKAIRLVRNGDAIQVADFDVLPFKQILTMPDTNVDEAVQLGLDQFLSKRSVNYSTVVVSVPGNSALVRFAKLPPVEPKRIPDIVKFEAVQQIPFPIDQVEWDYQVFSKPDSPDVEVGIFAIVRERLNQHLANYRAVGMNVDAVTISPLAVYNAFAYDMQLNEDSPGVIFMDIGTTSTDLVIAEGGNIWPRTLPKGGNNFTEALVRSFKLSFPKAEKLKREAGTSKYARQIFQAMRPVFSDLVQEMQRSLGFYQSLNRETNLTKIVGVGSTFRLPGMQKFLKQQLQMEVVRPDGFERLKIEGKLEAEFDEQALNLATAYGLALQGLGLARVEANVLPKAILKQRLWRAKQPYMAASAVLFVAATGAAYGRYFSEVSAQKVAMAKNNNVAAITREAQKLVTDWSQIQSNGSDPRQKIGNLRGLLNYRDIWPLILSDLDTALLRLKPQPELLTADYTKIQAMYPQRGQRRRMYIQSIKVTPEYTLGASGPSGGDSSGGGPPGQAPAGAAAAGSSAPRFVITIEGDTPYLEYNGFVNDLVRYLRDSAQRAHRPYKVVDDMNSTRVMTMTPVGGRSQHDVSSVSPFYQSPTNTGAPSAAASHLPTRPLAGEPNASDTHFVIKWTIQLTHPGESGSGGGGVAEARATGPGEGGP